MTTNNWSLAWLLPPSHSRTTLPAHHGDKKEAQAAPETIDHQPRRPRSRHPEARPTTEKETRSPAARTRTSSRRTGSPTKSGEDGQLFHLPGHFPLQEDEGPVLRPPVSPAVRRQVAAAGHQMSAMPNLFPELLVLDFWFGGFRFLSWCVSDDIWNKMNSYFVWGLSLCLFAIVYWGPGYRGDLIAWFCLKKNDDKQNLSIRIEEKKFRPIKEEENPCLFTFLHNVAPKNRSGIQAQRWNVRTL